MPFSCDLFYEEPYVFVRLSLQIVYEGCCHLICFDIGTPPKSDLRDSLRAGWLRLSGDEGEDLAGKFSAGYSLLAGGIPQPDGWAKRRLDLGATLELAPLLSRPQYSSSEELSGLGHPAAQFLSAAFGAPQNNLYAASAGTATKRGFTSFRYRPECKLFAAAVS
jgi:hypothetical protein